MKITLGQAAHYLRRGRYFASPAMLYLSHAGLHLILLVWLNLTEEQTMEIKSPGSPRGTGEQVSVGVQAARATS